MFQNTGARREPRDTDFMSAAELKDLTIEKVVENCRKLTPLIAEESAESEKLGRPTDRAWEAIIRTGYFYLMVPKKYGGLECGVDAYFDATIPIAEGDLSTGWICSFAILANFGLVNFPVACQDELFGNNRFCVGPGVQIPLGKARKVEGGYRVTGHWKWGTCCQVANWAMAVAEIETPDGVKMGNFIFPIEDVEIVPIWQTAGLSATGTHDIRINDVFVPDHRVAFGGARDGSGAGAQLYKSQLYSLPTAPILGLAVGIPMIGAAKGAVREYRKRLMDHTKRGTSERQAEKQASQIRLARADIMVQTAELMMRKAGDETVSLIGTPGDTQFPIRSKARAKIAMGSAMCREAITLICEATGTSIHYLDNPLQRFLRDAFVGTSHVTVDYDVCMEQHGRAMLGFEPNTILN